MRTVALLFISTAAVAALGCQNRLETGYKPRAFNSTPAQRRGFYAGEFTQAAREAKADRDSELESRRARPGY